MLYSRFQKFITEHCLIAEGSKIITAVSGGVDSMVLLNLISRIAPSKNLSIVVAHVNYGLRGRSSDADEKLVREVSEGLGFPCEIIKKKPRIGMNLQSLARAIRYDFLQKIAARYNAKTIATAHHADDQAETVLMHLIRGAGLAGLLGMRRATSIGGVALIRPLLSVTRMEIEKYARQRRISFRNDASNAKTIYSRNRMRYHLLPLLKKENPRVVEVIASAAERLWADEEALQSVTQAAFVEIAANETEGGIALIRSLYLELPLAIRVRAMRMAFSRLTGSATDLNADQLRRMDELALSERTKGEYRLPSQWKFFMEENLLIICKSQSKCDRRSKAGSRVLGSKIRT